MIWVQAENSKIDPLKDPMPLVMFGAKCRFRPIALEALQKDFSVSAFQVLADVRAQPTFLSFVERFSLSWAY